MADGSVKAIDDVAVGDTVVAVAADGSATHRQVVATITGHGAKDLGGLTLVGSGAQRGNGPDELRNGLDPARHTTGDRSAYVRSQDAASKWADYATGTHEDGYITFTFRKADFEKAFGSGFAYEGGPGREWMIPFDKIYQFNQLTVSRRWTDAPW